MTHAHTLSPWQTAGALAMEGICLLPPLTAALLGLWRLPYPPPLFLFLPSAWQPYILPVITTALYTLLTAPLRLWRTAYYRRLHTDSSLPKRSVFSFVFAAVGWRWRLGIRRLSVFALAVAPSALVWGLGTTSPIVKAHRGTVSPLCLALGWILLLFGILAGCVWQCRYTLAPLFILDGARSETAMALSARCMRHRVGEYVNFLGNQLPRLLLCGLAIPAIWILPSFRQQRLALLYQWMQPVK